MATLIGGLKDHISYVFTYDEQIRERVSEIVSFYAPFILVDAISTACGGIIRGAGKQKVGAVCYFLGYYGIGFPIGVPLMFAAKQGIKGLWTGLFVCGFVQCSFLVTYMVRMNWQKATTAAQNRAGVSGNSADTSLQCDVSERCQSQTDLMELVDTEPQAAAGSTLEGLSHRTLVLHRGLTLAAMLFILAVGIITNVLLQNLIT